ncbi:MAG: ABC transporter ATP-binding protein [Patulibacter sp.]
MNPATASAAPRPGAPTVDAPVLAVRELTKRYGERLALDGATFEVAAGEVLALLGPNGAGKSTLVGIVAGIVRADSGTAAVAGIDVAHGSRALGRAVGLAPQDIGIYPTLTVRQNLELFGELAGLRRSQARRRAAELLEPLSLDDLADRATGELSGGEQRRVHTAVALVHRPQLLILDEPTAGADPQTRDRILELVRSVAADGAAVVYTTHYLPEVERLGARVALLERGQIIASGTVNELVARHAAAALIVELVADHDIELPMLRAATTLALPAGEAAGRVRLQLVTDDPATALRTLIGELGERSAALLGVELVQPSLESAYLQLTGRRSAATTTERPR